MKRGEAAGFAARAFGLAAALASSGCGALLDLDVHYTLADASADTAGGGDSGPSTLLDGGRQAASTDASVDAWLDEAMPFPPEAAPPVDATRVEDAPPPVDARPPVDATPPVDAARPVDAALPVDAATSADAAADADVDATVPIEFVQVTAGAGPAQSTTVQLVFPNPVTAHDTIIVAADYDSPGTLTVTDSLHNTYQSAIGPVGATIPCSIVYALDVHGGNDTVILTLSQPPAAYFEIYVQEYSGIAALDGVASQDGTGSAMTSGTANTSASNDLIFAFGVGGTIAPGSGFIARSTFNSNLTEDAIAGAPGVYGATGTMVAGSGWTLVMTAFRPR
jgi:hypothetical protein